MERTTIKLGKRAIHEQKKYMKVINQQEKKLR